MVERERNPTFLCSLSFWVSANLTTIGEEHPSIVMLWCIALIATIAILKMIISSYYYIICFISICKYQI